MNFALEIAAHSWAMIAEMGPYLLLGFLIAALLHRLLKQSWVERLMGRSGLASIFWGSAVGVPMPLCSCGVIPVTLSLRDKGASRGATVSFLTSTPQTGVDSFLATYGMLGPVFAVYKLGVALVSGVFVGLVVELFGEGRRTKPAARPSILHSSASAHVSSPSAPATQPSWRDSFRYGLITMPGDISGALLLGFALAGVISAWAPAGLLAAVPGGAITTILIAPAITVPLYICSTGSIPLALALIHSGLPVGAALVLLVAGPATSIATITTMRKILGGRQTLFYVGGVVVTAWVAAFIYQFAFGNAGLDQHGMSHPTDLSIWKHLGGAALLALLLYPRLRRAIRIEQTHLHPASEIENDAQTATIHVSGMTCSHCEASVREGIASLPFVRQILSVDRSSESVVVQGREIDEQRIRQKLEALGFVFKGLKLS